jgi:hypothetical protein
MNTPHFLYPLIHKWTFKFPYLGYCEHDAMDTGVQIALWDPDFGYIPKNRSIVSYTSSINFFEGTPYYSSYTIFTFDPIVHKGSNVPTSLSTLVIFFFIVTLLKSVSDLIMVLICVSLMTMVMTLYHMLICLLWRNVYLPFAHFLMLLSCRSS